MTVTLAPVARERRHTLYFLESVRDVAPVFLDTDVDMSRVQRLRDEARAAGRHYSPVSFVLYAAGRVLARHPEANAAIRGRLWTKVARFTEVSAKVTLDKRVGGRRVVLATVVPDVEKAGLAEIQEHIDRYRDCDPEQMPEFAGMRRLTGLPIALGVLAHKLFGRSPARRATVMGTVAVTSLGHRPVDSFHSVGGTTVTLGVGRIADRPVARDGAVSIEPTMRLSLSFDHRVIDGAEAADVLAELKEALEDFPAEEAGRGAGEATAARPLHSV
jgi:pyruvate/2-oxoglutarate dehydrogenase complex dihydrolipoamide acyltransferase (E2) component